MLEFLLKNFINSYFFGDLDLDNCYFPDFNRELALQLVSYHELALVILVIVLCLVLRILLFFLYTRIFLNERMDLHFKGDESLEMGWSFSPSIALGILGYLSLKNLYSMEIVDKVDFCVKVTGHQWYWEYSYEVGFENVINKDEYKNYVVERIGGSEISGDLFTRSGYIGGSGWSLKEGAVKIGDLIRVEPLLNSCSLWLSEFCNFFALDKNSSRKFRGLASLFLNGDWVYSYDSYLSYNDLLNESNISLKKENIRNQDVRGSCWLVLGGVNELLISTADVIHRWGVSSFGVKADAIPGRVNTVKVVPLISGVFTGFCYELCGVGHSQIPILVSVLKEDRVLVVLKTEIMDSEIVKDLFNSWECFDDSLLRLN